ncbi:MAG TPA: hypothetical protein VM243_06165 [Phycisphaerae bacterium]|nr:hypothetical protein [Phycisphaerae bacterium]
MNRYAILVAILLSAALLTPGGCVPVTTGGTVVPTDGTNGGGGGDGGTGGDGGGNGGGGIDNSADGDGGVPNDNDDGTGGDTDTSGLDEGDGSGAVPPTVNLFVSNTSPLPQTLITLSCIVNSDGGAPVTSYGFSSTVGGDEIQQDGSATASAFVPAGLFSIFYTCNGTNAAGSGSDSPPVQVNVSGG